MVQNHVHVFHGAIFSLLCSHVYSYLSRLHQRPAVKTGEAYGDRLVGIGPVDGTNHVGAVARGGNSDDDISREHASLQLPNEELLVAEVVGDRRHDRVVVAQADGAEGFLQCPGSDADVVREVARRRGATPVADEVDSRFTLPRVHERLDEATYCLSVQAGEQEREMPNISVGERCRFLCSLIDSLDRIHSSPFGMVASKFQRSRHPASAQ